MQRRNYSTWDGLGTHEPLYGVLGDVGHTDVALHTGSRDVPTGIGDVCTTSIAEAYVQQKAGAVLGGILQLLHLDSDVRWEAIEVCARNPITRTRCNVL